MALSRTFKIGSTFDRVANWCKHDETFTLERDSLLEIGKLTVIQHFSLANSNLRKWYHKTFPMPLDGGNCVKSGAINISSLNLYDITNVSYGRDTLYHRPPNHAKFINNQHASAHESTVNGRWWWWMPGMDEVQLLQGTSVVALNVEKTLNIHAIRYPDLSMFTEADVTANVKFLDLPDYIIPFTTIAWAMAAFREYKLEASTEFLSAADDVVSRVADKLTSDEMALVKLNRDNLTD